MPTMANSGATQATAIRAGEVPERKAAVAPRQAAALAGQFAAMLETLNGVGEVSVDSVPVAAPATPMTDTGMPPAVKVGIGAVSLFAQESDEVGESQAPVSAQPDPAAAHQVVESAIQAGDGANFRWLATLLTQNAAE